MSTLEIKVGDFIYTVEDVVHTPEVEAVIRSDPSESSEYEPEEIVYAVTAINICEGSGGADIDGLINDFAKLDKLVLEAHKKECQS